MSSPLNFNRNPINKVRETIAVYEDKIKIFFGSN